VSQHLYFNGEKENSYVIKLGYIGKTSWFEKKREADNWAKMKKEKWGNPSVIAITVEAIVSNAKRGWGGVYWTVGTAEVSEVIITDAITGEDIYPLPEKKLKPK